METRATAHRQQHLLAQLWVCCHEPHKHCPVYVGAVPPAVSRVDTSLSLIRFLGTLLPSVQEPAMFDRGTRGRFLRTLSPLNLTAEPGVGSCAHFPP